MFLFLSKLLPLLIYPLGAAIALLIVAFILLLKKRKRICWAQGAIILAILLLWGSSNPWVATQLLKSLEWQYLPTAPLPTAEAIVVLGGATQPQIFPRPWVDLNEGGDRILHGIQLYKAKKAPLLILSGGLVNWRENSRSEAEAMRQIAVALGVPESDILKDSTSLNTHQNAVNVKAILDQMNIHRILLVTSAFHMPRSIAIFRRLGIETISAPTDFSVTEETIAEISGSYQAIALSLLPSSRHLDRVTRALKEYLGIWIYRLRGWA